MLHLSIVVQFDPVERKPAYMVPFTQVFVGRSTPLNFARYPAWCCYAMAVLGALPAEHCVDDIICTERACTIDSGWRLWRAFADMCGWRVPDVKSPPPSPCGVALGAEFDLRPFPHGPITVRLDDRRIDVITQTLQSILDSGTLSSGLAGQVWGKLQHACTMLWGKYGICKLRPFSR